MEENNNLKKEIIDILLDELVSRKIIKANTTKNSYEKTKQLLYDYNRIKGSKTNIEKQIKKLDKSKDSNDLKILKGQDFSQEIKGFNLTSNLDSINNRIIYLKEDIKIIDCFIDFVDNILASLPEEEKKLIELFYFQNNSVFDVAEKLNCDSSTVYKRINKIINEKLKIELFPINYITEIG